ncbi:MULTISPECIES: MmcQ/YjbR family DNA-binding protein [Listeria]|uniref:MmcQ/YjbR family DNA-binding protein n=1 Tax=Listeria TaxID=1637 RepID=UPI000B58EA6D|nr:MULTISPECIES: MmcQ/YjbR family DNA-binding protein [Listeria]
MEFELERIKWVAFCESLQGAKLTFPFGKEASVMKVGDKMFALIHRHQDILFISAKCEPERAERLKEEYQAIVPGYHLNKTHWISVMISSDCDVPDELLSAILENSYKLVFAKLSKRKQNAVLFSGEE